MTLQAYLENLRELIPGPSLARTLLRKGRPYLPATLTQDEREIVLAAARSYGKDFKQRECFGNAQFLVLHDHTGQLQYVEGYGSKMIPTLHGWATINGKVVDLTWRHKGREAVRFEKRVWGDNFHWEYFGMEIPKTYVTKIMLKDHCAKSLLDDVENEWPLLREDV